jgi:tyrosyl-tRNA synthetase
MSNVFDTLLERGFVAQTTHPDEIKEMLFKEKVVFYIGFDATADSLHVGHFLQVMAMAHLQRAGHIPIALIGGGTTMVGDPSGKTDMRKMLTIEDIRKNAAVFREQLSKFIDFSNGKAFMVDNAEWLLKLNYVDFLRDIGVHFSVNRMLSAECFKSRMDRGLSFLEFNYMIMQAYDFLELYRKFDCKLQLGGDDQWSNILAGADLIRKVESKPAYGMTFTLLTTSQGKKMGKTESGTVWLDAQKTSPYDFYQYWRNVEDADVSRCLALLTFLPMSEVNRLGNLQGERINEAKKVLAYEVTKLVHGQSEAEMSQKASEALFEGIGDLGEKIPTTELSDSDFAKNSNILDILMLTGLISSKGEGRRLIDQKGIYVNEQAIESIEYSLSEKDFKDASIIIRKGKKLYHRVKLGH